MKDRIFPISLDSLNSNVSLLREMAAHLTASAKRAFLQSQTSKALTLLEHDQPVNSQAKAVHLSNKAICHMQIGDYQKAIPLLNLAVQTYANHTTKIDLQLKIHLSEALLLNGQQNMALAVAVDVVQRAQKVNKSKSRRKINMPKPTAKLLTAKWLHAEVNSDMVKGGYGLYQCLLLGWLWRALAEESLSSFTDALRSYSCAMAVASIDDQAAISLLVTLKRRIGLSQAVKNEHGSREARVSRKKVTQEPPVLKATQVLPSHISTLKPAADKPQQLLAPRISQCTSDEILAPYLHEASPKTSFNSVVPQRGARILKGSEDLNGPSSGGSRSAFATYMLLSLPERIDGELARARRAYQGSKRRAAAARVAAARAAARGRSQYKARRNQSQEDRLLQLDSRVSSARVRARILQGEERWKQAASEAARRNRDMMKRTVGRVKSILEASEVSDAQWQRSVSELETFTSALARTSDKSLCDDLANAIRLMKSSRQAGAKVERANHKYTEALGLLAKFLESVALPRFDGDADEEDLVATEDIEKSEYEQHSEVGREAPSIELYLNQEPRMNAHDRQEYLFTTFAQADQYVGERYGVIMIDRKPPAQLVRLRHEAKFQDGLQMSDEEWCQSIEAKERKYVEAEAEARRRELQLIIEREEALVNKLAESEIKAANEGKSETLSPEAVPKKESSEAGPEIQSPDAGPESLEAGPEPQPSVARPEVQSFSDIREMALDASLDNSETGVEIPNLPMGTLMLDEVKHLVSTAEVIQLLNDLHAAFCLFSLPGAPAVAPTFDEGVLVGGGQIAIENVDLVAEAFGLDYLSPVALVTLTKLKEGSPEMSRISFVEFLHIFLRLLVLPILPECGIDQCTESSVDNSLLQTLSQQLPMAPTKIALLYSAFATFDNCDQGDDSGGSIMISDAELVLKMLDCHLEPLGLDEFLRAIDASGDAGINLEGKVSFHVFVTAIAEAKIMDLT